jgi:hypothetical protein
VNVNSSPNRDTGGNESPPLANKDTTRPQFKVPQPNEREGGPAMDIIVPSVSTPAFSK